MSHSLLRQRLLLVDADVEVHRLDPEQHAALDLSRQSVEHGPRQRDADVEAVSVPGDDRQHVGRRAAGGLGHLRVRGRKGLMVQLDHMIHIDNIL